MLILGSSADLAEYFFESEYIQAGIAASGLIGTFRGPRDAGTGYVKLYHSMGMATGKRGAWAYVRGAMGSVTQAMKRVAQMEGVEIRTGAEVAQVIHLTGALDWPVVEKAAQELPAGLKSQYHAMPYTHEMGAALAAADVVVSRACASALGEYPFFGLPAVLVPYP